MDGLVSDLAEALGKDILLVPVREEPSSIQE